MSPTFNWPNQVPGPWHHYHKKNCLTNLSKLPPPITRTWEIRFPIPDWLLSFFHIPHGLITVVEIYISAYKVNREENTLFFEIAFLRPEDNVWPHRVKQIIFMVTFSWPNPFYQEDPSRAACASSRVLIVSNRSFGTTENVEGSISLVPSSNPPGYPTLSPQPLQLSPGPEPEPELELEQEEALPVPTPIFTQAPSNTLSIQQILNRIWSGIDLDQITFNEGGIIFQNLQSLDYLDNPQFYSNVSATADENSSWFQEDRGREGEGKKEHQIKGEGSQAPLQPIQEQSHASTPSRTIPDIGNTLNELWPIPYLEWEEYLHSQLNKVFE